MSSVYGLNFWQYNGYFGDNMNRSEFGTADNDNTSRGGHTYVEQEETTKSGCPAANAGSSGQTVGQPWNYISFESIGSNYSRVWWGWFVTSYSGTLWFQTASDDSSLVYVSEDEFGQPTTSSGRTNLKTAAGGFAAIQLVVDNNGGHGRRYRNGNMSVVAGKQYFIRIYHGQGGGGDNMHFSWNDTGTPAQSYTNTMSYVKLDGSQSDKVLFYYNNPVQPKAGGSAPVDVSLGIVSWYDGASYDTSNSVWTDKVGNIDLCGNRLVGNIKTKSYLVNDSTLVSNRNNKKYIQKSFPTYLSGDKNTGISFSYDPSSQFLTDGSYTFFHVARRDPSDVNQTGRVFDGSGVNWYSGFNDASSGVTKHENDSINTIDKDYGTNWVVSVDTPKYYRSVGYSDTSSGYYETSSGNRTDTNTTTPQISIHYGSNTFQSPISTGGIITNYSNYSINTFLSSGTLSVSRNTTADFLIVGGGGGGGGETHIGGGGGAGGVVIATNQSLAAGSYNVNVGNGGGILIPPTTTNGTSESYNNGDDYISYTFINSGTLIAYTPTTVDFILVGGGGGGASEIGGGGGGGGVIIGTSQTINSGTYNITIGAGGNGGINGSTKIGSNGSDTIFNGFIAKGGGGGGYHAPSIHPIDGGSGGGCGADNGGKSNKGDSNQDNYSSSVNITGYGNDGYGGGGNYGSSSVGGGGGGAGTLPTSEDGGDGISNDFKTGNAIYYGGGGGGGGWARNRGLGGLGGGGNSDTSIAADGDDGLDGLGGGGGGGGGSGKPGGDGGSGIVIIRINTSSASVDSINGSDSTFNGFLAKGGGGGGTGNYIDASLSEKGDAYIGGSGGGGGGNYLSNTTPSYPGGNDGTDGGSSSQDTYSSTTNVSGYGNSGGGFTGIPASEGDDAGGGGGGAGGVGDSRSPNGGGTGNGGIGIQNDFRTNSLVYYAGGGGGGSGTSSTPGTGGSSLGGSGSNSSSVPSSALANSGSGGGGGNSAVNGGDGADGIVVVRVTDTLPAQQCDWNVAEVISYNRILDSTEENKVFNYLKNKYLGTQQSSTSELYQLSGEIEGGDMIRGFPPEFPLHNNIIGWYTNDSYEYDTSGVWSDISPFRHNLTATLNNTPISSDAYTDKLEKKINDIHPQLSYMKGNNEVGFNFPSSILPDSSYTLIYVARKPIDGTDVSGRIIDSKTNVNFYSGFTGTKTGVAFHST